MFDRDDVGLALYALEEGMTAAAAGELVGASGQTVSRWARGCVPHSDRGWHHRTPDRVGACERMGIVRSMSRRGRSPDNAACEAFFGRPKVKLFHFADWSGWAVGAFCAEPARHVDRCDSSRLKAFREGGRTAYDTTDGRRARLGLSA